MFKDNMQMGSTTFKRLAFMEVCNEHVQVHFTQRTGRYFILCTKARPVMRTKVYRSNNDNTVYSVLKDKAIMNIHEHESRVLNTFGNDACSDSLWHDWLRSWFEDPKFVGSNLVLAPLFFSLYSQQKI